MILASIRRYKEEFSADGESFRRDSLDDYVEFTEHDAEPMEEPRK